MMPLLQQIDYQFFASHIFLALRVSISTVDGLEKLIWGEDCSTVAQG